MRHLEGSARSLWDEQAPITSDRYNDLPRDPLRSDELRKAQLASFARQTPLNAWTTVLAALVTGSMLWPVASRPWVLVWCSMHIALALTVFLRWRRHRGQPSPRAVSRRVLHKATLFALISGMTWGSGVAFIPFVPDLQQKAMMIVIAGLATGASATLAAVPLAASLFILSSLLPLVVYYIFQAELAYFGLAAMALLLTSAMLLSTRVVYGALLEEIRVKQDNATLLEQFHAERQEWLEISETTEAFALFDERDRLLLWNENYHRLFAFRPNDIHRGAQRIDLLRECAPRVATTPDTLGIQDWIDSQLQMPDRPEASLIQQLRDGRWLQSSARRTAYGRLLTLHLDITERQQAEEEREQLAAQLHHSQKMEALGTLAGGIAHEFNNMLAAMLGFAELTQHGDPSQEEVQRNMDGILTAGRRARDLVQQILAFSRRTDVERAPTSIHQVIREVLLLLQASLPATITIQHNSSQDVGAVLANANQLHQVVMNLCANAEYAMRETGGVLELKLDTIEVDTGFPVDHPHLAPGSYVRLSVRDTGRGMSSEVVQHIFEPFYTTKDIGEGTGMGLAIVHGIVLDHGGDLTVDSTLGVGTTFRVYLPRWSGPTPESVLLQESIPHGSERILFVDDEAALVQVAQGMLSLLGYHVRATHRSSDALNWFRAAPYDFDLVITDQTMPNMTGDALTRELRCLRPDIPIIVCTGFSYVMDDAKARNMGVDAFLLKPIVLKDMALAIRRVLNKRYASGR